MVAARLSTRSFTRYSTGSRSSARTPGQFALAVALVLSVLLTAACASDPSPLSQDLCPVYGRILGDDSKVAYARGNFLQYRCQFAEPAPLASALPPVSAPPPARAIPAIAVDDAVFEFDSSELEPEAQANLRRAVEALREYPELSVSIVGFTDSTGPESYNQRLSERRSMAAREFLIDAGVSPQRIDALAAGEHGPAAPNDSLASRSLNRRVEIDVR